MRKCLFIWTFVFITSTINAQVTIGSGVDPIPGALLDIKEHVPDSNNATATGGILLPRVQLTDKMSLDGINSNATDEDKTNLIGLQVYNVGNDDFSAGVKIWNGNYWNSIEDEPIIYNGLTFIDNSITLGGTIIEPTTINSTTAGNSLEFNSSVAGSNLLVTGNAKVGIGTTDPTQTLDIEGTLRFSTGINGATQNKPNKMDHSHRTLAVSLTNGKVIYSPTSAVRSVGGYRPGEEYLIAEMNPENALLRVSFVCNVDKSNDINHSSTDSYTYGDFTVVGMGPTNPIKFIDVNIKGSDGKPKVLTTQTDTVLEWSNLYISDKFRIVLDQKAGTLSVENGWAPLSYIFQLLGGM